MSYSSKIKKEAVTLRKQGFFYSEIAQELDIAKSTAYAWTKDIKLSSNGIDFSNHKIRNTQRDNINKLATINKERKLARDQEITLSARNIAKNINLDISHKKLVCSMLFWCEGGKDISAGIQFANSDPNMVRIFMGYLRECFDLDESKFRALIHLHSYHDALTQTEYWSQVTKIPINQFHKPYLKKHAGKTKRINYPGCISIRYLDRRLGKLLEMIYTEFSELKGYSVNG